MRERKKILIVDDDPGVCSLLSDVLQQRGYETSAALDGQDGLEKAGRFLPNLILLDLKMPIMDGWQMLMRLRQQDKTRNIPVVFLTAESDTDALLKSEQLRAADFFIKPINIDELLLYICRYI